MAHTRIFVIFFGLVYFVDRKATSERQNNQSLYVPFENRIDRPSSKTQVINGVEERHALENDMPTGTLGEQKDNTYDEYERMAVSHCFFRKRLEYLQWLLQGNNDVEKEMKFRRVKVHVPADIHEKDRQLFTSLYRTWLAIFRVLCRRSVVEKENAENHDYVSEFKDKLLSVGLQPNPGTEEKYAADVTWLMINMSQYSELNFTKINWKNETEVMKALSDIEGDQQKIARAIYRLKLIGDDIWYD